MSRKTKGSYRRDMVRVLTPVAIPRDCESRRPEITDEDIRSMFPTEPWIDDWPGWDDPPWPRKFDQALWSRLSRRDGQDLLDAEYMELLHEFEYRRALRFRERRALAARAAREALGKKRRARQGFATLDPEGRRAKRTPLAEWWSMVLSMEPGRDYDSRELSAAYEARYGIRQAAWRCGKSMGNPAVPRGVAAKVGERPDPQGPRWVRYVWRLTYFGERARRLAERSEARLLAGKPMFRREGRSRVTIMPDEAKRRRYEIAGARVRRFKRPAARPPGPRGW